MNTMSDLVEEVRSRIRGSLAGEISVLDQPYVPGSGSLILRFGRKNVMPGSVMSAGITSFYILDVDSDGKVFSVIAGHDGSPDLAVAANQMVRIKPAPSSWSIFRELQTQIRTLSNPMTGLFGPADVDSIINFTSNTYFPPTTWTVDPIKVVGVRWQGFGPDRSWKDVDGWTYQPDNGGVQVWAPQIQAGTIRVTYALPFSPPIALTDDLTTLGLPSEMWDIPVLGALSSLQTGMEARRLQPLAQGDGRKAEELAAGSSTNLSQVLRREYQFRVNQESSRLQALYGVRQQSLGGAWRVGQGRTNS